MPKLYQQLIFKAQTANEEKFTLEGVFSTSHEDRHGDVVEQNWDLKTFKINPVILNSHTYNDATEVVGKAEKISVKDGNLQGKIQFAVNENPKAKIIFDLYKGGFLNAFSVGFIPKEFSDKGVITKSELLEISAVSVPANAYALAKAKGIEVDKLYGIEKIDTKDKKGDEKKQETKRAEKPAKKEIKKDDKKKEPEKKEYDHAERWDEGDNEIRYKLRGLGEFEEETFERAYFRQALPSIKMTIGKNFNRDYKSIQMIFFPKENGWAIDDAKEWVVKNIDKITNYRKDIVLTDEVIENEKAIMDTQKNCFSKIQKAIKLVGEDLKVESRSETVRAENNRLINKTIRELIKIKQKK